MQLTELTSSLRSGSDLNEEQAVSAADLLKSADVAAADKEAFLLALSRKGESVSEVAGLAKRFRDLARDPGLSRFADDAIDVCGTGGDKIGSFNISTTVTFVLAAAGVPVFKHGNRSITSKCGSANLLEALGVDLMAPDAVLLRAMEELGFCFMFAPAFHPAFKEIMPVRQALAAKGERSVFNVLGPLINPAGPAHQVLGVYSADACDLMASVLEAIGIKSGMVVHCRLPDGRGIDEISTAGISDAKGFGQLSSLSAAWEAKDFGLAPTSVDELLGGDVEENLQILDRLLNGKAPKGLEDTVVCNVAAALMTIGKVASLKDGVQMGRDLLLGGATQDKIAATKEFYSNL